MSGRKSLGDLVLAIDQRRIHCFDPETGSAPGAKSFLSATGANIGNRPPRFG